MGGQGWWRCLRGGCRPCTPSHRVAQGPLLSQGSSLYWLSWQTTSLGFASRDPGLGNGCPEFVISRFPPPANKLCVAASCCRLTVPVSEAESLCANWWSSLHWEPEVSVQPICLCLCPSLYCRGPGDPASGLPCSSSPRCGVRFACAWRWVILSCEFTSRYCIFITTGKLNSDFRFCKDFESCSMRKKRYSIDFLQMF